MMKPSSHATLFASMIVAIALSSTAPRIAAAAVFPIDPQEVSPSPEDDRATIVAKNESASMHAALRAEERKQASASIKPDLAQAPADADVAGGRGSVCQIPSSNGAGDVCRAPSSGPVGSSGTPYLHPGYGTRMGPRTYMLPLDESQQRDF
ncbi:hypothetical protein SOM61_07410 [Massilia sp. CFBP9012]|uniref:hypothetical protein n=1 Tax=Massilia sp. CFBP9012 TaxID=3096531 RepID=UPI002A6A81C4|nr:hypothetical protein [Massilia sp. CFBP9012]MDY0974786.1 hypothetical protein [Massilia sp. CFBP9012]